MALATMRARARRDILELVPRGLGACEFTEAVIRSLRRAVQFDGICLLTTDPATLLPTSELVEHGLPPHTRFRLTEIELRERDFNKLTALARGPDPAASLSQVTHGELDRSLRQRELRRPAGFGDELRVVLRDQTGAWGALTLLRSAEVTHFSTAEVRFLASLAAPLADGLRRAAVLAPHDRRPDGTNTDSSEPAASTGTGLLILTADDTVELANDAAQQHLIELDGPLQRGSPLPAIVRSVGQRTRATVDESSAGPDRAADQAWARVRTAGGPWLIVRGSLLGTSGRVAIMTEPAGSPELAPLIADAYGLTDRERRVTELVARGFSTNDIGARLHLSAYTVQDHLKAIFNKTGSGSRGDLVARLFFEHYAPRLTSTTVSTVDDTNG